MSEYEKSDYDQSARYAVRLNGVDFLKFICRSNAALSFERWFDTRNAAFAESKQRVADLIGSFRDDSHGGIPWCWIFEFKSQIDSLAFEQIQGYLTENIYLRPDPERGSRFEFGLLIVNLTGEQDQIASRPFLDSPFHSVSRPWPINLASFDAQELFDRIDRGELGFTVLPFAVLMKRGDEAETITRWLSYVVREPNPRRRADYYAIALQFAQLTRRRDLWAPHMKEDPLFISEVARGWMSKGREEGREEGQLMGRIAVFEELLLLAPTPKQELEMLSKAELESKLGFLQAAWNAKQGTTATNGH